MSDFIGSIKRGVKEYARSSRTSDGRSTLHIAAVTNSVTPLQTLLDAGVDRTTQDRHGNTALHLAAAEAADISLRTLLTYEPRNMSPTAPEPTGTVEEIIDLKNTRGETALHLACKANSLACLELLIEHSSDIYIMTPEGKQPVHYAVKHNSVQCVMHLFDRDAGLVYTDSNNEPLIHLAASKEMVDLLIRHGVDATARDTTGLTVIHAAIKNKNFPLLMALLLSGVPVNQTDAAGNTALHTAVFEKVEHTYAKTLIVFGAQLEARNSSDKTAYEVAVEQESEEYMALLSEVGAHDPEFLARGTEPSRKKLGEKKGPRPRHAWAAKDAAVLCIDGGGIKGVVATQILLEIEKRTSTNTADLFDWISGSSIGSLVVMAVSHAGLTIQDMHRIFFDLKDKIFNGTRPYKTDNFEQVIKDLLGDVMMNDMPYPRIIATTTIGDVRPCQLHLFTNYEEDGDEFAWRAGRASGAAPSYFSAFENKYLDGGVMSNNPTLNTLVAMRKYYNESKPKSRDPCQPKIVISIGTGLTPTVDVDNIDVGRPRNIMDAARFASGAVELMSTFVEQCTNCDGPIVEQSEYWCESVGASYHRLQPALEFQTALDEKSDLKIILMSWETCQYIYKERAVFAELCAELAQGARDATLLQNVTNGVTNGNFIGNLTNGILKS